MLRSNQSFWIILWYLAIVICSILTIERPLRSEVQTVSKWITLFWQDWDPKRRQAVPSVRSRRTGGGGEGGRNHLFKVEIGREEKVPWIQQFCFNPLLNASFQNQIKGFRSYREQMWTEWFLSIRRISRTWNLNALD